eukprot:maker-scaffold505_size153196-snap-gene-0.19 protein:Tk06000 transcript:maker-scaffold505_size153196-snap-gene-0.19-mRNA-1 annotation:"AGAP006598-PA"
MPVGCLSSEQQGSNPAMDVVMTSSVLNTVEQFAFMQHTLLLQIFRVSPGTPGGRHSSPPPNRSLNGSSSSSSSSSSSRNGRHSSGSGRSSVMSDVPPCPTCIAFSDQCCQQESGLLLYQEFLEINLQCYWDAKLSEALTNLRYQGYVCPGILVLLANNTALELIADAWKRRLLLAPPTCRISQFGLSNGCVVKPVLQTNCISLQDILCLILARLKQRNQTADMITLCDAVEQDWSGANQNLHLKDSVHAALGQLIKQRKVYYTGKGYFLVNPSDATSNPLKMFGNRFSRIRHSLRDKSTNAFHGLGAECKSPMVDQEVQTSEGGTYGLDQSSSSSASSPTRANDSSPTFNLERSQSLRVSKKSMRNMAKGGSLRLSKKDALIFKEGDESNLEPTQLETTLEDASDSPTKTFERKNSFLGKFFNKKKSQPVIKPQVVTFSAQFPPPEIVEALANSGESPIYSQIKKKPNPMANEPTASPRTMVRNGPNGNFDVYERSNPSAESHIYNHPGGSIYGQMSPPNSNPIYGQRPPIYGSVTSHSRGQRFAPPSEPMYSNPPPPLPYCPTRPSGYPQSRPSSPPMSHPSNYSNLNHRNNLYGTVRMADPLNMNSSNHSRLIHPRSPLVVRNSPNIMNMRTTPSPATVSSTSCSTPTSVPRRNESTPRMYPRGDFFGSSDPSTGSSSNSSSGPSSIDSQQLHPLASPTLPNHRNNHHLYDDTLVVIEKSNHELELKLDRSHPSSPNVKSTRHQLTHPRVDTIHNNRNLSQEVIYEIESNADLSRTSSQSTLKNIGIQDSVAPSYPSLNDLSLNDIDTNFKSLTAQKLMAGLSFNSIDTLIEVNAVADARVNLNESTETVDFGVI